MREILFRAKRMDNGEWVEGFYNGCYSTATIDYQKNGRAYNVMVAPTTVCQYTGLTDKNGVEIFEGDMVSGGSLHCTGDWTLINNKTTVTFEGGMFKCGTVSLISFARQCEVIGNVHDEVTP